MAIANDTKTVVGVFSSVSDAQAAVRDLETAGITRSDISLVANKNAVGYETMDSADRDKASDVVADAGIGAAIGGVGGLLLSAVGAITIPVIGPILAAGPIAAALTGAGIGAATGGLIGALTESGVPEDHAKHYAEGVRRGDVLVTVKADSGRADIVGDILDRNNAVDVDERVSDWQNRGWSGYSNDASPYTDDELRTERSRYSTTGGTLAGAGHSASSTLSDAGHSVKSATSSSNPGNPGRGDLGDRTKDALAETGREMKEFGRDVKDVVQGKTSTQPHDLKEQAREAERRRRSRVY